MAAVQYGGVVAVTQLAAPPRRNRDGGTTLWRRRRRKNALSPPLHSALFSIRLPTLPPRYATLSGAAPQLRFCCAASPFATVLLAPRLLPLACLTQLQSLHIHAVWKQGIQLKFALTKTMLGIHDCGFRNIKISMTPKLCCEIPWIPPLKPQPCSST